MTPNIDGDEEIERIALGLVHCTLPKPEWTHRAHFAAALWLLTHPEVLEREGGMAPLIRRYNVATGVANSDTGGYHETITQASLRAAAALLAEWPGASLAVVLDHLMAGPLGDKHWPLRFWSEDALMAVAARRAWAEPDRAPLPYPPLAQPGDAG